MTKKYLALGLLAFSASLHAENYPKVSVIGSNPVTGAVATVETLITDGKGDVVVDLRIYNKYEVIYRAEVTETLEDSDGTSQRDYLPIATARLIKSSADKLKQLGIDLKEKGTLLYAHPRKDYGEGGPNYDLAKELKIGAEKNLELSIEGPDTESNLDFLTWDITFTDTNNPSQPMQKLLIYDVLKSQVDEGAPPNVGFQQVYLIKSEDGGRLLVLSSYQTFGLEGPNTNFVYTFFNVVNKD